MGRKSRLSDDQKLKAVLSMLRKEESVIQIARRYGVSEKTLYLWQEQFLVSGKAGLSGSSDKALKNEVTKLKKDIEERDRVIGEITIANAIMKKKMPDSY